MKEKVCERKHRLPAELYEGIRVVSFTLCIKNRKQFFISEEIFRHNENVLLMELKRFLAEAEVYMFMPEHVHLLLRGVMETSDVLNVVRAYKQRSGFWLCQHHPEVHWQKDFYDHIERREEDVSKRIRYILDNPVRKGLVNDWQPYPIKGSTIHNLNEW